MLASAAHSRRHFPGMRGVIRMARLSTFGDKKLEFVQCARPVFAEQARQSAISQKLSAGLAHGAIFGFVLRVTDALDFRAAARARLFVTAVHGHALPERRHVFGELS